MTCEYCREVGGDLLWHDALCRVVLAPEPDFPGFCRVILQRHEREMSDLAVQERERLMNVVFATEAALRECLHPDKINLASLGNMTPHVHWHVIPRFCDDTHFPAPVWATARRERPARALPQGFAQALLERLAQRLGAGRP